MPNPNPQARFCKGIQFRQLGQPPPDPHRQGLQHHLEYMDSEYSFNLQVNDPSQRSPRTQD